MLMGSSAPCCAAPPLSRGSSLAAAAATTAAAAANGCSPSSSVAGDLSRADLTAAAAWGCCTGGPMPFDSEGKAKRLRPLSFAPPHMRSFTVAWLAHFCAVFGEGWVCVL